MFQAKSNSGLPSTSDNMRKIEPVPAHCPVAARASTKLKAVTERSTSELMQPGRKLMQLGRELMQLRGTNATEERKHRMAIECANASKKRQMKKR
jgi:hypothetical protein